MDPNSELFRAKQQVIYYRAEIAQCNNKISELKKLLEKEAVRNKYLQSKIRELVGDKISGYQEEIEQLRKKVMELEVELEEEKSYMPIENVKENPNDFYSYFNYSIILPAEEENTLSVYGTFNIINTANMPMDDLVVCLKVTPVGAFTFSAKISDPKLLNGPGKDREDIEWVYAVEDWRERILKKGEYWIKLIRPKNKIKLSFELLLDREELTKSKLIAEVYVGENNTKAVNNIVIQ